MKDFTMQGYWVIGQDNDSYAFVEPASYDGGKTSPQVIRSLLPDLSSGTAQPGLRRCDACGEFFEKSEAPLTNLKIKKRNYDISITYDGVTVVSAAFRKVCEELGLSNIRFINLPNDSAFYSVEITETVGYDPRSPGLRYLKPCPACGRYESVLGPVPVVFKEGHLIPDLGFVKSDIEFGSNNEKHPAFFCGNSAGRFLKSAKLKGLYLESV